MVMVVVEVDVLMRARMLLLNASLAEFTSADDVGAPEALCATLLLESSFGDVNVS